MSIAGDRLETSQQILNAPAIYTNNKTVVCLVRSDQTPHKQMGRTKWGMINWVCDKLGVINWVCDKRVCDKWLK